MGERRLACALSADHVVIARRAIDETYLRVGGQLRYLWRAIDANDPPRDSAMQCPAEQRMVDVRLTARRDAQAAKAFLNKATARVRLHRPVTICTDKAHANRRVIREINRRHDPHFDGIRCVDLKARNTLIESDHAAMKRLHGNRWSFRSVPTPKATPSGIETTRTIKPGKLQTSPGGGAHHRVASAVGRGSNSPRRTSIAKRPRYSITWVLTPSFRLHRFGNAR